MEYLVVIEKGETSYGAYVPDLPGCVAVGETRREVLKLIREGIELHIEALREAGATQKMTVVPGETAEPASDAPRVRSRDSIEAVALGNPLVRQAQELFHAEVRSVLDLREKSKS